METYHIVTGPTAVVIGVEVDAFIIAQCLTSCALLYAAAPDTGSPVRTLYGY